MVESLKVNVNGDGSFVEEEEGKISLSLLSKTKNSLTLESRK